MPRVIPTFTLEEVAQHKDKNSTWLSYEGNVYDVSQFVDDHPGGMEVLREHAGGDVTDSFNSLHRHSEYAKSLLAEYKIGELAGWKKIDELAGGRTGGLIRERAGELTGGMDNISTTISRVMMEKRDEKFLNLNKPIISQVWNNRWTRQYYVEQIHIPRHTSKSPRFFANPFLELFTKNTWQGVLIFWIPVIIGLFKYASDHLPPVLARHYFVDGVVLWTLYEYAFHRFIFHMDDNLPSNQKAFVLHFLVHGVHHFLPMDKYRLVMPPILMCVFSLPVAGLLYGLFGRETMVMLMAGSFTGYVAYDLMHYYSHHGRIMPGYLKKMKSYHMAHHYTDPHLGFGVSNMIWDVVFDTMLPNLGGLK